MVFLQIWTEIWINYKMSLTPESISLEKLKRAPLKNEEIIDILSSITSAEAIEPYIQHVKILASRYDMTVDTIPLEIQVLSQRTLFRIRELKNLYQALDHGYYSLITDLATFYQTDPDAVIYVQNLEAIFGAPDYQFVDKFVKFLRDGEMEGPGVDSLYRFYKNRLTRIAPYAEIPPYIREFQIDEEKLPQLSEPQLRSDLPRDVTAGLIADQVTESGLIIVGDDEDTKETIVEFLDNMNDDDYEDFIKKAKVDEKELVEIRTNLDLFRLYGPSNPYPDMDFSEYYDENGQADANVIYGGARMFSDMSLEYDYDDDSEVTDWFQGYCMQCSLRIRAYHYAVREPKMLGGWFGCFCRWDCVREYLEEQFDAEEDTEKYNLYMAKKALITAVENDMDDIGIAERDYEEPSTGDEITQDMINAAVKGLPKLEMAQ